MVARVNCLFFFGKELCMCSSTISCPLLIGFSSGSKFCQGYYRVSTEWSFDSGDSGGVPKLSYAVGWSLFSICWPFFFLKKILSSLIAKFLAGRFKSRGIVFNHLAPMIHQRLESKRLCKTKSLTEKPVHQHTHFWRTGRITSCRWIACNGSSTHHQKKTPGQSRERSMKLLRCGLLPLLPFRSWGNFQSRNFLLFRSHFFMT